MNSIPVSRNGPCWCGSGKRLKSCHGTLADPGRQEGEAPLVVCHAVNLLGNVLRAAASDKILADTVGARFAIVLPWSCRPAVRAAVDMLFAAYPMPGRLPALEVKETALMSFPGIYGTNSDPVLEAVFVAGDALPRKDFWVAHIYAAAPLGMSRSDYVRRKIAFYASLSIAPALTSAVDAFAARHDLPNAVGVHVRNTDNLRDPLKRDLQLNTPLPVFADRIEALVSSGRRILLCSDDAAVLESMRRQVRPEALIFADTVPDPLLQGLYEMLLLSRTEYVVGSYASTFSYEACFIRGIDLECYERGAWRRYPIAALAAG
jgi:hypothetical protein